MENKFIAIGLIAVMAMAFAVGFGSPVDSTNLQTTIHKLNAGATHVYAVPSWEYSTGFCYAQTNWEANC